MSYTRLRVPFQGMSFTPDVPSNALAPNEYNNGRNIEADVRGLKKVAGEQKILSTIPGNPIFIDGGFQSEANWVYVVATREGKWYKVNSAGISNITPGVGANPNVALSYTDDTNITSSWVGTAFIFNANTPATPTNPNPTNYPPMYLLPNATEIRVYDAAPDNYIWNYDVGASAVYAGFVRNYCSPNVGNILIAGNITKTIGGTDYNYPTTVRWSQAFGLNSVSASWNPTLSNVANEQEVPVRGPIIDGFFLGANFYICSYWDTVVLTPIAYQNSTAPVFAVRLFNQGRGLINNNCWSNTDSAVYGIDSRDIWVFDGSDFAPLGNQKVRDYFYSNLSPTYSDRVFMVNNTQKNQIEIYYPDLNSTGWCNKMISWRYDLQVWNAPKDIQNACNATEGPVFTGTNFKYASRTVVYARGSTANEKIVQTGIGTSFIDSLPIPALFERTNASLVDDNGVTVPYSNKVYVHRILPEVSGSGTLSITVGGANSTAQTPTYGQTGLVDIVTDNPWITTQQQSSRTFAVKIESNDTTSSWNITALNLQGTVTEDAF